MTVSVVIWGVPKLGVSFGESHNEHYRIWGSFLGSPNSGAIPYELPASILTLNPKPGSIGPESSNIRLPLPWHAALAKATPETLLSGLLLLLLVPMLLCLLFLLFYIFSQYLFILLAILTIITIHYCYYYRYDGNRGLSLRAF